MLKNLSQFNKFDFQGFSKGKVFSVVSVSEYKDFNTKEHLGTKVEVVILEDKTEYINSSDSRNNRFEKLVFKVTKDVDVPVDARINPINAIAKVFGEFQNQLSITCSDIEIVKAQASAKQ